ncbi:hypothetical protein HFO71_10345 [Rhizobium laguerreae]|uniref:hypothetical protein n=1 Tax=Rhizobium laguerreae TaxID=1076926 RepID=UPI001C9292F2|nr:hypothetical protein [Rhizobium laguerreae]MBY3070740.1 hypothetical protein [Rhizobium laguerreae]
MPLPKNTPAIFDEILADYRHGTIDADAVREHIADATKADAALQKFKDEHLAWTDYDDSVQWL